MAKRTISTRIAIEGESEYRSSLARIASELKANQSALKMVESQYKANAASMEALTAKSQALKDVYEVQKRKVKELAEALENAQRAENTYRSRQKELTDQIEKNNRALEELKKSTGDTTEETQRLEKENQGLNRDLADCNARLEASSKGVNDWQTKLNLATGELYELDTELTDTREALDKLSDATRDGADAAKGYKSLTENQKNAINDLSVILASSKIPEALGKIKDALVSCVEASVEFESAMAGVKKTTDLSDAELTAMGDTFKRLSTEIPITASELAGIAESAGQLGIEKSRLVEFTTVMANLGVATNLTSEEAATLLARFANVTGMDPANYERLGSVVVGLGNNFATTESEIVNMAQRLSAAGSLAGLTEPQIMALAASMSSVGIQAEAGGTAMTQSLTAIEKAVTSGGDSLEKYAKIAGMSADDFSAKWKSSPIDAITAFISGLGKLDEQGESTTKILEDLGLKGIRQENMLKSLSQASGMLSKAVGTANDAWADNNALAKEAATRYETTESKFKMLQNSVDSLKIAVGDQLNPAINELVEAGTESVKWAADFIKNNEAIVPAIAAVTAGIAVFAAGATVATVATTALGQAIKAATIAAMSNPYLLAATAVAALGTAIFVAVTNAKKGSESLDELTQSAQNLESTLNEANSTYNKTVEETQAVAEVSKGYLDRIKELESAGLKTTEQQDEYHRTIRLLCAAVPELTQYLDEETSTFTVSTQEIERHIDALRRDAFEQAKQERLTAVYKEQANVELDLAEAKHKHQQALDDQADAERNLARLQQQRETVQNNLKKAQDKAWDGDKKAADQIEALSGEYQEIDEKISMYSQKLADAERAESDYQKAIDCNEEALQKVKDTVGDTEEALEELEGQEKDNSDATRDNTQALLENEEAQQQNAEAIERAQEMIGDLAQEYRNAYDAAYQSISGQTGLFGEFTATLSEDTDTVEEMMDRWAKQAENVGNYTKNLKLAAQYGIDDGLIKSLSDGSAESAAYLQTIIDKYGELGATSTTTKEEIEKTSGPLKDFHDNFNSAFQGTQDARDAFSNTVVSMREDLQELTTEVGKMCRDIDMTGIEDALKEAFSLKGVDYEAIGVNFTAGLAGGITAEKEQVAYSAEEVADLTLEKLKERLGIHSPSTVTHEIGENFDAGFAEGVAAGGDQVLQAVDDLTGKVEEKLPESARESVSRYTVKMGELSPKTKAKLDALKKTVSDTMAPLPNSMRTIGEQMISGMIAGIQNRSSTLYATISGVTNSAIEAARKAAATASPSKKTKKIFEDVGDGMIVGLEAKREKVLETAKGVVNEALQLDVRGKVETAIAGIDDRLPVMPSVEPDKGSAAPTYQIGDIKVEIHCESGDPDEIYNAFSTRLQRDIVRAGTANAARV